MLTDIIYLRYFGDVTSVSLVFQAWQVREVGGSIIALFNWPDVLFFVDLPLLICFYPGLIKNKTTPFQQQIGTKIKLLFIFSVMSVALICLLVRLEVHNGKAKAILNARFSNKMVAEYLGMGNYHLYDMYEFIKKNIALKEITPEELSEVSSWFDKIRKNVSRGQLFGVAEGKNLILIQVEALQQFAVNLKVNGQEVTPNINKLSRESAYFSNFYDQTCSSGTSDAEFVALTSLYPAKDGSAYFIYSENQFDSLPEALKANGYYTFSAHAFSRAFWNRAIMHRQLGFQESMFRKDFAPGENIGWGLSDAEFFSQISRKLDELPQPFFAFLITLTSHHPYNYLPEEKRELDLGELDETMMGDYLQSIHYADKALGEFIEGLEEKGLLRNSILAIYGDHDAALPDEELGRIGLKREYKRQYDKVPFLIFGSERIKGTYDIAAGHLDITPTLIYLLGIPRENFYFMGKRLIDNNKNRNKNRPVVFGTGSFVEKDKIFITPDGSFENGTYIDKRTIARVHKEEAKDKYLDAQERLKIGRLILEGNMVPLLNRKNTNS
ncbi:LTA synthase family protein [Thermincola ferriacetica]